jgi:hypothetical protein
MASLFEAGRIATILCNTENFSMLSLTKAENGVIIEGFASKRRGLLPSESNASGLHCGRRAQD